MVTARVTYNDNSLIDIEQVFYIIREVLFTNAENTNKVGIISFQIRAERWPDREGHSCRIPIIL